MKRDLEMDLLRTFVAVAGQRSFTHAARSIGRTQSAVSLQIKRLEDIVGKGLFERSRQTVRITAVGESLLVYANRILAMNDAALSHVQTPEAEGLVRIGAPDDYATFLLPSILKAITNDHPLMRFEVICDNACELLPKIDRGELDIVVATHEPTSVAGQIARYEPLHWAASPAYSDDPEETLSLVLFPTGCVCRGLALAALEKFDRSWQITYSTRSIALIEQVLLTGTGVTVMEASTIPPTLKIIDGQPGFPVLPDVVISVHQAESSARHVSLAADYLLSKLAAAKRV